MVRTYLDHNAEILQISLNGTIKTKIVYDANLNFKIVKARLRELIEYGLLMKNGRVYQTTSKGERFLYHYEILRGLLEIG